MKDLQFTIVVQGRDEDVPYLKHLLLGSVAHWDQRAKVQYFEVDTKSFEFQEKEAIEKNELEIGL